MRTIPDAGVGSTWSGSYSYQATALHRPTSVVEAQRIVAGARRIRALGTRHSFNDIADSDELLTMEGITPEIELDTPRRQVRVSAGVSYGTLARHLDARGFALHNMGSLPHISIGGATATGTHGSGDRNGALSTAVSGIELITGSGELMEFDRSSADFGGLVPSLGAMGVVSSLTLDVEPSYQMRQDVFLGLPWETALTRFDEVTSAAYSVSLFTSYRGDAIEQVWLKSRLDAAGGSEIPSIFFGAPSTSTPHSPVGGSTENTTAQGGTPGGWLDRLPHFRLDSTPSNGDEIQSEYLVHRADAPAAIAAIRELADVIAAQLIVSEIRTVAADSLWLSMASERASVAIHFTWKNNVEAVNRLLPWIEAALEPFAPRPHWGKQFVVSGETLRQRYSHVDGFARLRSTLDPGGVFDNAYLRRVFD
ncbi:alditol oxidase [Leifsonia kafniensis]|uniref:Alditol oxidase n=1 Tax=Leifsonia kafniensis TaxID=475957 RepID=A0ABP7KAF6_9MICO